MVTWNWHIFMLFPDFRNYFFGPDISQGWDFLVEEWHVGATINYSDCRNVHYLHSLCWHRFTRTVFYCHSHSKWHAYTINSHNNQQMPRSQQATRKKNHFSSHPHLSSHIYRSYVDKKFFSQLKKVQLPRSILFVITATKCKHQLNSTGNERSYARIWQLASLDFVYSTD